MIFGVRMPFTEIPDFSIACRPLSQRNILVTKRHSHEQKAKPLIQRSRGRCLLNEHVRSVDRTEQNPSRLAIGIHGLGMLCESL